MKTQQIKSEKFPQLVLTIDNGEFLCLMDAVDEVEDAEFVIDTADYAYELYRVLKKADEMGAFDKIKGEDEKEEEEDIEVILVKEIEKPGTVHHGVKMGVPVEHAPLQPVCTAVGHRIVNAKGSQGCDGNCIC